MQAGATTASVYSLYKPISDGDHGEICRNTAYAENFFKRIAWIFSGLMIITAAVIPFFLNTGLDRKYVFISFINIGINSFKD